MTSVSSAVRMPATHSTTRLSYTRTSWAVRWFMTMAAHSTSTAPAAASHSRPLRLRVRGRGGASPEGRRRRPARETRCGRAGAAGSSTPGGGRRSVGSMHRSVT
jgi:hypothetical protein